MSCSAPPLHQADQPLPPHAALEDIHPCNEYPLPPFTRSNPYNRKHQWAGLYPKSPIEAALALKTLHEQEQAVGLSLLNLAQTKGYYLDLTQLNAITHHWPNDFTVNVELGLTLGELNRSLAPYQQWWPHSAPPNTPLYQILTQSLMSVQTGWALTEPKDSILGLHTARPNGHLIKTGGRVRKNVSGYDMRPLYLGTHGAFGIPLTASLSVSPRPQQATSILIGFDDTPQAFDWLQRTHWSSSLTAGRALLNGASLPLIQKLSPTTIPHLKPFRQCAWLGWLHLQGHPQAIEHWLETTRSSKSSHLPDTTRLSDPIDETPTGFGGIAHFITGHHGCPKTSLPHLRVEYTPPLSEGLAAFGRIHQLVQDTHFPYGLDASLIFQPAQGRSTLTIFAQHDYQLTDPRLEEIVMAWQHSSGVHPSYMRMTHAIPEQFELAQAINQTHCPITHQIQHALKQQFDPQHIIQHPLFPV